MASHSLQRKFGVFLFVLKALWSGPNKCYLLFSTIPLHTSSTPIKINQHSLGTHTPCTLFVLFIWNPDFISSLSLAQVPLPPPSLSQPTVNPLTLYGLWGTYLLSPHKHLRKLCAPNLYIHLPYQMINDYICLIHLHLPKPRFLNLAAIILGQITLLWWDVIYTVGCLAATVASSH